MQFGKEKYEQELLGRRSVSVRFWLPAEYTGREVTAWLSEYRACKWPPVQVPVPYDIAHGRPLDDSVERIAQDDAGWRPVPITSTKGPGPESDPAVRSRSQSLYEPRSLDENRVRLAVAQADGRPYVEFTAELLRGSYLLSFPAGQDLLPTRYPFEVAREFPWREACEIPAEADVPALPPEAPRSTLDASRSTPYWVYVPAGPYRASGDPKAQQSPLRDAAILRLPEEKPLSDVGETRSLPGYYIARFEVTCPMYLAYLNDREWHKRCNPKCGDWGHVPRKAPEAMQQTAYWPRGADGRFSLPQGWEEWPVIAVSWNDATDYCRWLTQRPGAGAWEFVLPSEDEWEKASRGPDGRYHAWGDSFDDTFCAMVESRIGEQKSRNPESFGLFPLDEGPCGVRDVAGGVIEWTRTESGSGVWRIRKGGAWGGQAAFCRCASRGGSPPEYVVATLGLRVVARRTP